MSQLFIGDGQGVCLSCHFTIVNPTTGLVDATCPRCGQRIQTAGYQLTACDRIVFAAAMPGVNAAAAPDAFPTIQFNHAAAAATVAPFTGRIFL